MSDDVLRDRAAAAPLVSDTITVTILGVGTMGSALATPTEQRSKVYDAFSDVYHELCSRLDLHPQARRRRRARGRPGDVV